ncbi:hypothetical protein CASFOL_016186 [Castilleja foliolosa]|uniref:F-box domain-containing protein n=1 Tax=Castilleja foliolosa TaxID=1961234 RepID=A0ABD3DFV6_9LAMI
MADYMRKTEWLLEKVLVGLPGEDLVNSELVCKDWRDLIKSPDFLSAHHNHHILCQEDEPVPSLLQKDNKRKSNWDDEDLDDNEKNNKKRFELDPVEDSDKVFIRPCLNDDIFPPFAKAVGNTGTNIDMTFWEPEPWEAGYSKAEKDFSSDEEPYYDEYLAERYEAEQGFSSDDDDEYFWDDKDLDDNEKNKKRFELDPVEDSDKAFIRPCLNDDIFPPFAKAVGNTGTNIDMTFWEPEPWEAGYSKAEKDFSSDEEPYYDEYLAERYEAEQGFSSDDDDEYFWDDKDLDDNEKNKKRFELDPVEDSDKAFIRPCLNDDIFPPFAKAVGNTGTNIDMTFWEPEPWEAGYSKAEKDFSSDEEPYYDEYLAERYEAEQGFSSDDDDEYFWDDKDLDDNEKNKKRFELDPVEDSDKAFIRPCLNDDIFPPFAEAVGNTNSNQNDEQGEAEQRGGGEAEQDCSSDENFWEKTLKGLQVTNVELLDLCHISW